MAESSIGHQCSGPARRLLHLKHFGFTSAPEAVAFSRADAVVSLPIQEVVKMARAQGHNGIVLNFGVPVIRRAVTRMCAPLWRRVVHDGG